MLCPSKEFSKLIRAENRYQQGDPVIFSLCIRKTEPFNFLFHVFCVYVSLRGKVKKQLDRKAEKLSNLQCIARLCNGSTNDFGSFCRGSNPCRAATLDDTFKKIV